MRNKRFLALSMTVLMAVTTISVPANIVKAEQVEQEYVVLAKNDVGLEKAETKYGEDEVKESEQLEDNNVLVIEMTEKEAQKLEKDKDILLVEEDILFEGSDFEDEDFDEIYGSESDLEDETEMKEFLKELRSSDSVAVDVEDQWNIDVINANEQEYIQVNDKVKVAVLDTGVTATEDIDVAGRVNFIEGEEEVNPLYEDVSGHGTSVASVIAAKQNDIGITGINPNAELYSVKILDDQKKESLSGIIEGIYWCIDHDIDIINMSFGTSVKSEILEQVIKEADKAGILMIAAAGNKGERAGESTVEYPAAFAEVIAVGASTPQGEVSDMSSVGKEVELMAPGESVPATGYFDEVIKTDGTSMAAPHVAGVASILWAKDRSKSSAYIRALLNASAKAIGDEKKMVVVL